MNYIDVVAVFALLQFVFFSMLVSRARGTYQVVAPAVVGHEQFERAHRVQMNTMEQLVVFLPALFLAGRYWPQEVVAAIGSVYIIGRLIYWRAYVSAPSSRGIGFLLTFLPTALLLLAALVGAVVKRAV